MRNDKQFLALQLIPALLLGLTMTERSLGDDKSDKAKPECEYACCIPGKWAVEEEGRYLVALYKQNRVLRLCVDAGGSVVTLTVDGGGLVLIPGICSDFEGKDFRIESRGPASHGSYDIVR